MYTHTNCLDQNAIILDPLLFGYEKDEDLLMPEKVKDLLPPENEFILVQNLCKTVLNPKCLAANFVGAIIREHVRINLMRNK